MSFILPPRTITFSPATASSFPADRAERGVTGATIPDAALTYPTHHLSGDLAKADRATADGAPVFHDTLISAEAHPNNG